MAPRSLSLHNLLDMQPIAEESEGEPAPAAAPRHEGGAAGGSPGNAHAREGFENGDVPGDTTGGSGGREGGAGESRRTLASSGMLPRHASPDVTHCATQHMTTGTRPARGCVRNRFPVGFYDLLQWGPVKMTRHEVCVR